ESAGQGRGHLRGQPPDARRLVRQHPGADALRPPLRDPSGQGLRRGRGSSRADGALTFRLPGSVQLQAAASAVCWSPISRAPLLSHGSPALSPMVMTGLVFAGANNPKTPGRGIVTGEALVDLERSPLPSSGDPTSTARWRR